VARTIHCTVIEVPAMTNPKPFERHSADGFRDLVPWADPYIAALVEKLRNADDFPEEADRSDVVDELPPPFGNDQADRDIPWQADWSPRNWPRLQ
jgi:hypothetical protein